MRKRLTRRRFAGALAAVTAAPALLASSLALPLAGLAAQEKKPAEPEKKPTAQNGDDEDQALKRLRAFSVPDGAEPAFVFRASW